MARRTIFAVVGFTGRHDSYTEWIVLAHAADEHAKAQLGRLRAWVDERRLGPSDSHVPITREKPPEDPSFCCYSSGTEYRIDPIELDEGDRAERLAILEAVYLAADTWAKRTEGKRGSKTTCALYDVVVGARAAFDPVRIREGRAPSPALRSALAALGASIPSQSEEGDPDVPR